MHKRRVGAAAFLRRSMRFRFSAAALAVTSSIVLLAGATPLAAQNSNAPPAVAKRSITEKDLFSFVWTGDPQISPDGARAVFTRVVTDDKRTGYETSIWMVATSGDETPVRLTNGKHDAHPRWSPDGKLIAFVRGGEKDDSGKPRPAQIAILSLGGGEARIVTDLPKGAGGPVWSPDSKRIAFSSSTTQEDIDKEQHKKNDAKASGANNGAIPGTSSKESAAGSVKSDAEGDHESDIHIITRAVYRSNDE